MAAATLTFGEEARGERRLRRQAEAESKDCGNCAGRNTGCAPHFRRLLSSRKSRLQWFCSRKGWHPMKEIQLREAKATLSTLVEAAEKGEPTTITKRGRPAAVIVSHAERKRLKTRAPSFADLLLAVPPLDPEDLPKRRPARILRKAE
jgi:antitoxin Phd